MKTPLLLVLPLLLLGQAARAQAFEVRFHDFEHTCGPTLAGSFSMPSTLTLTLRGGLANEPCFWILGLDKTRLPIPVYGCEMYVVPLLVTTTVADAGGAGVLELRVPILAETRFFAQAASFRIAPNRLFASHGLEVEVRAR